MRQTDTQEKILNAAENLTQKQGYNAFSYRDLAKIVGIKTSSIHYYYPAKEDLGVAVIQWQREKLALVLDKLKDNAKLSTREKLLEFLEVILAATYHDEMKMCLGGMFASDALSLPKRVREEAQSFFIYLNQWVQGTVSEGKQKAPVSAEDFAKHLLLQIEGGLLLARLYGDKSYLNIVKRFIHQSVG